VSESNIRRAVLANGVRLATERMPHVRSVAVGIWLTRGSRHEPAEHQGIAHFVATYGAVSYRLRVESERGEVHDVDRAPGP